MGATPRSRLMKIERRSDHMNTNHPLPERRTGDFSPHDASSILFTEYLKNPVLLHKHTIITVGAKTPEHCHNTANRLHQLYKKMGKNNESEQVVN